VLVSRKDRGGEAAKAATPPIVRKARKPRPSAEPPEPSQTRRVTPQDLLPQLSYHRPLTPSPEAPGAILTFRHPDLDGSGYTGSLALVGIPDRYLKAERGFVTTSKPDERRALERMGWVLWRTEIEGARPAIMA